MHLNRQFNCWSLRCSWNIACRRCSNYIFFLYLTPGSKDKCKMRRESCKFWDLACLILQILRYSLETNKANLRDLIAATGLVILLKLDLNRRFFSPCDLEIWWMTPKNNRASLLCYFKLFASFRSHWWIQTGVRVRKRPIWVKFDAF